VKDEFAIVNVEIKYYTVFSAGALKKLRCTSGAQVIQVMCRLTLVECRRIWKISHV